MMLDVTLSRMLRNSLLPGPFAPQPYSNICATQWLPCKAPSGPAFRRPQLASHKDTTTPWFWIQPWPQRLRLQKLPASCCDHLHPRRSRACLRLSFSRQCPAATEQGMSALGEPAARTPSALPAVSVSSSSVRSILPTGRLAESSRGVSTNSTPRLSSALSRRHQQTSCVEALTYTGLRISLLRVRRLL